MMLLSVNNNSMQWDCVHHRKMWLWDSKTVFIIKGQKLTFWLCDHVKVWIFLKAARWHSLDSGFEDGDGSKIFYIFIPLLSLLLFLLFILLLILEPVLYAGEIFSFYSKTNLSSRHCRHHICTPALHISALVQPFSLSFCTHCCLYISLLMGKRFESLQQGPSGSVLPSHALYEAVFWTKAQDPAWGLLLCSSLSRAPTLTDITSAGET